VQPEKLVGVPEPADFDAFWAKQKAKLATVPLKAELVPVTSPNPQFDVFDVKIDCPGGKPVSGYLTYPKGAAPKSLMAQAGFMGYGIKSTPIECRPNIISLTINAHGIENGKEPAFYDALGKGDLKGYAFDQTQNSDAETAYFNGMMLRVMRSLEYLKSRPEWNGKDLIAAGGSQGGLQAISAAALDPAVTWCLVFKPWCCDLGGGTLGRLTGWRPAWTTALAYYDPINHAKRVRCKTTITSGLGDYVCPPSGISVLYNQLTVEKKIDFIQGATHGFDPPGAEKFPLTEKAATK
jgi:cephalosporin-C deacetylase-like acetyl esterase